MAVLPIVDKLPEGYTLLIGEAVTAWAVQEYELRLTVFTLLDLDPKRGRLAVRSARAKDTVEMVGDLLSLSDLASETIKLPELAKLLDEIETRRNTLAHNIWMRDPQGRLLVQSLTGVWPSSQGKAKVKRRVEPAGIPIAEADLRDLVAAIYLTINQTRIFRREMATKLETKKRKP